MSEPKKVKYVGPSPAVSVTAGGVSFGAENGKPIEVPDELARSLCEQDVWKPVGWKPDDEEVTDGADPAADSAQEG